MSGAGAGMGRLRHAPVCGERSARRAKRSKTAVRSVYRGRGERLGGVADDKRKDAHPKGGGQIAGGEKSEMEDAEREDCKRAEGEDEERPPEPRPAVDKAPDE